MSSFLLQEQRSKKKDNIYRWLLNIWWLLADPDFFLRSIVFFSITDVIDQMKVAHLRKKQSLLMVYLTVYLLFLLGYEAKRR